MENLILKEGERLDDLERNNLKLIQNPKMFCFGMDAVLLTGFANVRRGERLIDLGCGNGIMPLLLSAKTEASVITGLEIQEYNVDMARRSVIYNKLEDRVNIIRGDIREASEIFGTSSYDVVVTNPPYMKKGSGIVNEFDAKTIARHEVLLDLGELLREVSKLLSPSGRLYMVHRPTRLTEIFSQMSAVGIEPKRMRLVHPYVDKEPNMVLIEGIKGAKPYINIDRPLIVYKNQDEYTEEIYDTYGY